MGHIIRYIECDEHESRAIILDDIQEDAARGGDGYHSNIKWHDNVPPLASYEEAQKFIERHDKGWYDDHAVRFKDYSKAKRTAKIAEYELKIKELIEAQRKYREEHSVHLFKAKHIGCEKCGSKLNKEYLVGEKCPLCKSDLRSKTTLDKLKWYSDKADEYRNRIEDEKKKQEKSVQIKWLIKYEYHC